MIFSCKDDSLDYQVYFYEDIDNTMSFETINSVSWILSKDNKPSFGIKDSTVWLKVILPVNHSYQYIQIEYPLLDSIDIHYTDLEGNSINLYGGDRYPYNTRSYLAPSYIFLLDRVTTNPVFIKIRSTSSLLAAISMHTSQSIQKSQNKNTLILGIYFGFLILIALYNILLSISLRDMTFGFYSVYVSLTCLTFFSLEGFSFQHLWPNSIQWNNISFVFISALAFIAALEFTKRYLRLTFRNTKIRFWILTIYQGCLFILGCSVALVSYRMFSGLYNIIAALVAFSIFFISMYSVINGDRPARYFLFAWTIFLFGMIILPLRFAAILPDNSITHGIPFIGSALEVLLLSLGLGDRFNQQRKSIHILTILSTLTRPISSKWYFGTTFTPQVGSKT